MLGQIIRIFLQRLFATGQHSKPTDMGFTYRRADPPRPEGPGLAEGIQPPATEWGIYGTSALMPKEEVDRIAVPNQKSASVYSTEEILKGREIEYFRGTAVQQENSIADKRYKDLENKMGMRPGIDGAYHFRPA
jgi:hypothetical protein